MHALLSFRAILGVYISTRLDKEENNWSGRLVFRQLSTARRVHAHIDHGWQVRMAKSVELEYRSGAILVTNIQD